MISGLKLRREKKLYIFVLNMLFEDMFIVCRSDRYLSTLRFFYVLKKEYSQYVGCLSQGETIWQFKVCTSEKFTAPHVNDLVTIHVLGRGWSE